MASLLKKTDAIYFGRYGWVTLRLNWHPQILWFFVEASVMMVGIFQAVLHGEDGLSARPAASQTVFQALVAGRLANHAARGPISTPPEI